MKDIERDSDRDYYMTAAEACKYGLVDEVIKSRRDLKNPPEKSGKSDE